MQDPAIIREGECYLGDAVYVSFDGYQLFLRTGDGNDNQIALDPSVYQSLLDYVEKLRVNVRAHSTAELIKHEL